MIIPRLTFRVQNYIRFVFAYLRRFAQSAAGGAVRAAVTRLALDRERKCLYPGAFMPAYYRAALSDFARNSASEIMGILVVENAKARFPLAPDAIDAWRLQLPPLQAAADYLLRTVAGAGDWHILLEYPIPRVGKRIDAVLIAGSLVIVIETKTGTSPTSAARQVDDYALNLACFHEASHERTIVPLVVSDAHVGRDSSVTGFESLIKRCECSGTEALGATLAGICRRHGETSQPRIDAALWDEARFKPVPPIVEAAVALYSNMDVFEIGHACAAREDLKRTTQALIDIVDSSRAKKQKSICFVTGVPGAGKTLVGLNTVHQQEIKEIGSFLSGNRPLVKVIREALVRDEVRRTARSRAAAELEVESFIHNVHRFADDFYRLSAPTPNDKVVLFDEAQRAWNAEQNKRAYHRDISEPQMLLEIMDRHPDWAVIVALVGGGQEIHRGEAGLSEWGRALARFREWQVYASPYVQGGAAVAGFHLFEAPDPFPDRVHNVDALHLDVSTRSIRAQRISDWVNAVLVGDRNAATRVAADLEERPALTRDLATARSWLRQRRRGRTRTGLVASASASRLRADGIETAFDFHQAFDWEHWFLDDVECSGPECNHQYCNDVRASSKLEVAATQFEIQGLELDWVGVCWGEDLVWDDSGWRTNRFTNKLWRLNENQEKHAYRINAYRVLLTRARQGMIIYVPDPTTGDLSRKPAELNSTYEYLVACGAQPFSG